MLNVNLIYFCYADKTTCSNIKEFQSYIYTNCVILNSGLLKKL